MPVKKLSITVTVTAEIPISEEYFDCLDDAVFANVDEIREALKADVDNAAVNLFADDEIWIVDGSGEKIRAEDVFTGDDYHH